MYQKNYQSRSFRSRAKRERDSMPWRYCLLTVGCGLLLGAGFFLAARTHFSAMNYSMHNAKLRRLKESLLADQRRLVVAKETAMSPAEINKAARKLGLQEMSFESLASIPVALNTKVASVKPLQTEKAPPRPSVPRLSSKQKSPEAETSGESTVRSKLSEQAIVSAVFKRERTVPK